MKKGWPKYVVLIAGFIILVILEYYRPTPVDWSISFENDEMKPYACFVLYHSLPDLFPAAEIEVNTTSYYQLLKNRSYSDAAAIIITDNFTVDVYDSQALLNFVRKGNQLYISAADFSESFMDSCGFVAGPSHTDSLVFVRDTSAPYFVNPILKQDEPYSFKGHLFERAFSSFDTISTTILGEIKTGHANFVRQQMGKGSLFIHLQPLTHTNYNVLYGSPEYTARSLSYLNASEIIWDEYYKPGRALTSSPIRYILGEESLKYAYYLLLSLILIYILVKAKRNQRIIPVIKPPENTTHKFINTIGLLYFQRGNHHDLAMKKITYLTDYIKEKYFINLNNPTDESITRLVKRSGFPEEDTYRLLDKINRAKQKKNLSEQELTDLNKRIEEFYRKSL